ncbi:hypothetical protein [Gluconobacter morbifer]|uniref:TetR family transcriptional regulator n=1 Tax=Gluconobacter morbifer G707 TaxID=1088869 RepID=G6XKL1_9PROT|nr:hypothetical protein [Gluconobacter morbifer]EHH67807.1 hypothetical protein GMO_20270 [Gluconobacter morbifer G707]
MDERQDPFATDDMASESRSEMDREAFDLALLQSALTLAGDRGWHRFSLVEAARDAGLPVEKVRALYPVKPLLLLLLGRLADESALRDDGNGGTLREYLFDLMMRRFDIFQEYREGLRAVLHALPYDPPLAALLTGATLDSMRWLAEAAGVDCAGLGGIWRVNALAAVWGHAFRAWEKDESSDLSSTMAALDSALGRAERLGILKPSPRRKMDEAMANTGLPDHDLELES